MKQSDWVFISAVAVIPAIVGFTLGAVSASSHSSVMPHGVIEYWFERYQTLITGILALLGVFAVWIQIKASERQHRISLSLQLLPELNDLNQVLAWFSSIIAPMFPELIDKTTFRPADDDLLLRLRSYPAASRFVGEVERVQSKLAKFNNVNSGDPERDAVTKKIQYNGLKYEVESAWHGVYGRASEICEILEVDGSVLHARGLVANSK